MICLPDQDWNWGESVKAVVALEDGQKADEEEIMSYCRERLAGFKIPLSVDFSGELPKADTGKILKKIIKAPYWKDRDVNILDGGDRFALPGIGGDIRSLRASGEAGSGG